MFKKIDQKSLNEMPRELEGKDLDQVQGGDGAPTEEVTLGYTEVEWTYNHAPKGVVRRRS